MVEKRGRNLTAYVRKAHALKRFVARHNTPCWICGRPIDVLLPANHGMAFTADHVRELSKGGALLGELRPAHRACNSMRSNRKKGSRRANINKRPPLKTSKKW